MAEPLRDYVIDNFGRPVSGASVSVKIAGTANDAALFSDDALTAGVSNPLTTEADGSFYAYAANGKYDLVVTKTGYTGDPTDTSGLVLWDEQITKTVTATYSQSLNDYILLADASSAPFTINLLALSGVAAGRPWVIMKVDSTANAVTIDPSGAETINGASTLVLSAAKQGVIIRKGSTEWQTDVPPAQVSFGTGKVPLGRSSDGKLDSSWGGVASSLATLDSGGLVPQTQLGSIVGEIRMYGGASAPTGYLFCDGAAVSRATYAVLFDVIADVYGVGDGSTTFNVPDMRGRVPSGVGTGAGGGATGVGLPAGGAGLAAVERGRWKGEESHQLTVAELASHAHSLYDDNSGGASTNVARTSLITAAPLDSTVAAGSDVAHNNIQPIMGVNFIIKY